MSGLLPVTNTTLAVSGSNVSGDVPFSAALRIDGSAIVMRQSPAGERGDLAQLCQQLCADHAIGPADIERLLVDVGPGSYTGLRVAITFVRFLQAFGQVEVGKVCSLAMMVQPALGERRAGRVRALLDARRGRYHTALFEVYGQQLVELDAPAAVPTAEALDRIATDELLVMPAALAEQLAEQLRDRCEVFVARDVTADHLFHAPITKAEAADLEPRYLMASYAED